MDDDISRAFPRAGNDADKLRLLVRYAILAPSGHNTQPWKFRIDDRYLELQADRSRALPVVDPADRALTISCGAALEHLVVAARYFGLEIEVEPLPGTDPDLLARISISGEAEPNDDDRSLFRAMSNRRTTRGRYDPRPVSNDVLDLCRHRAASRAANLLLITDPGIRSKLADLVAEGDRRQFDDPAFRDELAAWIRSRRSSRKDGVSADGFGMPDVMSPISAFVVRHFDVGEKTALADRDKVNAVSAQMAVLATAQDEPIAWLNTGRALSQVLLTLADAGATAAFLNQPIEVPELRPRLQRLVDSVDQPQLLLRLGYGPDIPAAARRPVSEVLV